MLLLLPFIAGASATGYVWYNNSKEQEKKPSLKQDVYSILLPLFILLLALLFLRWLYNKGSIKNN